MKFSRIVQLFLGIILGLLLVAGATAAAGYYFLSQLADTPQRPVFPEEMPKQPEPEPEGEGSPAESAQKQEKPEEKKPDPAPSPQEPEKLEPGAYKARVTWPEGLSLRDSPSKSANRIGGVAYNRELIILKTSEDGQWQQIRIPGSKQVGWVKAGNADKIN